MHIADYPTKLFKDVVPADLEILGVANLAGGLGHFLKINPRGDITAINLDTMSSCTLRPDCEVKIVGRLRVEWFKEEVEKIPNAS